MYLSDKKLQNGDHILVTDVGLDNNDALVCWINRRIISDVFRWHHKLRKNVANEPRIGKVSGTREEEFVGSFTDPVTLRTPEDG